MSLFFRSAIAARGAPLPFSWAGGSLAGKDSAEASSTPVRRPLLALCQPAARAAGPAAGATLGLALAAPGPSWPSISTRAAWKPCLAALSETRSWGRRGPARLGSTVARSSSTVWE